MGVPPRDIEGLRDAFLRYVGPDAIDSLRRAMSAAPTVLIGGGQLTGKSKITPAAARLLNGRSGATGALVRHLARRRGLSIEEMSYTLVDEPEIDVRLDYAAACAVARGDVAAFECRMAGALTGVLRCLGRRNLVSVFLTCAPWERALRYVAREVSKAARLRVEPLLAGLRHAPLHICLEALCADTDPAVAKVARRSVQIARRDASDRARLQSLYGVDCRASELFDLVVDTTHTTASQTRAVFSRSVLGFLERQGDGPAQLQQPQ